MRLARFVTLLAVLVAALLLNACGESEQSFPVRTYNMGEKVALGHLVYQVYETQWLTHIGEGVSARIPQNRFFLVRLSVLNSLNSESTVPTFSLEDDNGAAYAELSSGEGVPQYIGYLRSVKGSESASGNAIFDAPPKHYKLKITDETGEKTAFIDIPLNFVSETPGVPEIGNRDKKK